MNISDTFYVALCMTILIIGVVYWFWTQNQYIQRKLNLLENIVYELKTTLNAPGFAHEHEQAQVSYPSPTAFEEEEQALHEELHEVMDTPTSHQEEKEKEKEKPTYVDPNNTPVSMDEHTELLSGFGEDVSDSLQPGGAGNSLQIEPDSSIKGSSLDAMTLKELRRLAEQRKISGASNMRKQTLIDALRNNVSVPTIVEELKLDANVSE